MDWTSRMIEKEVAGIILSWENNILAESNSFCFIIESHLSYFPPFISKILSLLYLIFNIFHWK